MFFLSWHWEISIFYDIFLTLVLQIVMLKQKLKDYEEKYSSVPAASNPVTVQKEAEVKK